MRPQLTAGIRAGSYKVECSNLRFGRSIAPGGRACQIEAVVMDHLWSPWRYAYITSADKSVRAGIPETLAAWPGDLGCVFCNLIASVDYAIANGMDREKAEAAGGVVMRGKNCFVCLN